MTDNKIHRAKLEIDANKAVVYLCGSVSIVVTLWLGTSVTERTQCCHIRYRVNSTVVDHIFQPDMPMPSSTPEGAADND